MAHLLALLRVRKRKSGWPGQSAACPGSRGLRHRGTLRFAPATRSRGADITFLTLNSWTSVVVFGAAVIASRWIDLDAGRRLQKRSRKAFLCFALPMDVG